jgi:hypothetical protein
MKKQQQAASLWFLHFWDLQLRRHKQFRLWKEPVNVNYMDKTVKPANDFSDM